jgi:UDP-N-acetylmuramyl pentapeptide synthase
LSENPTREKCHVSEGVDLIFSTKPEKSYHTSMSSLLRIFFCFLARICILRHKPFVVGITGSFGKTTARHILTEILKKNHQNVWTPEGNYNGEWGLALAVLQVKSGGHSIL